MKPADLSRTAGVEKERLAAAGGVLQQRLQAEVVPLGRLEIPACLESGRELAGLCGFGEDAHLRAALLRDQLFDIADLHAGEDRDRVGRGGLRSGYARDDAGAVAVLPVFDARRQRDEVGELVAQLAADGVAGAVVDVAGAGGAEGGEVEEVARPGEEWRQGRAENARDLGVDETADPVAAQERDFRVAAQLAVEGKEFGEGGVVGHPDLRGGPAAAAAKSQDRQEGPAVGCFDLDARTVEVSGDVIEDAQAAQAGEIRDSARSRRRARQRGWRRADARPPPRSIRRRRGPRRAG